MGDVDIIFALTLLAFSWPSFYARFSSDQSDRIGGILWHFIEENVRDGEVYFNINPPSLSENMYRYNRKVLNYKHHLLREDKL